MERTAPPAPRARDWRMRPGAFWSGGAHPTAQSLRLDSRDVTAGLASRPAQWNLLHRPAGSGRSLRGWGEPSRAAQLENGFIPSRVANSARASVCGEGAARRPKSLAGAPSSRRRRRRRRLQLQLLRDAPGAAQENLGVSTERPLVHGCRVKSSLPAGRSATVRSPRRRSRTEKGPQLPPALPGRTERAWVEWRRKEYRKARGRSRIFRASLH